MKEKRRLKKSLILFIAVVALFPARAFASEGDVAIEDLMKEIKTLKAKVNELERKIARQEAKPRKKIETLKAPQEEKGGFLRYKPGEGVSVEPAGLNMSAGATFVAQTAVGSNFTGGDHQVSDASYTLDIEIEKKFSDQGRAFIHLEGGDGSGLDTDELTFFSGVNRDAGDSGNDIDVTEVWYEHYLFDGRLVLTGGKLDPTAYLDQNGIANDECGQFLSSVFRNSAALEFPDDNACGLRMMAAPADWLEVEAGVFDDDADWEDVFEDIFSFAQVGLKPGFLGREGNYRAYFWYDDSGHTKWSDAGVTTRRNLGFGISCDQEVIDNLTFFSRCGWQDPDVSVVEWAWSAGFQLDGAPWARDDDYLGCAIGMDIPGGDYGDAGNFDDPEGHMEAYYNFRVNNCLSVSPDYQLIWDPNGEVRSPISVIGVRGQADF